MSIVIPVSALYKWLPVGFHCRDSYVKLSILVDRDVARTLCHVLVTLADHETLTKELQLGDKAGGAVLVGSVDLFKVLKRNMYKYSCCKCEPARVA